MEEQAEQALRDALALAEGIIDTIRDPLLLLDGDLRVVRASREFYRAFGATPGETEGRLVYELGNGQWHIPRLRQLLEEILPQNTAFRDYEVEYTSEGIGRKVLMLNARKLHREGNGGRLILLAIEDVTERRDAERGRRDAEVRFTEMVKNVRDHSIFLTDPDGVVTSWNVAAERIIGHTEAEAVGRHFSLIFTPEDVEAGLPEQELRQAREWGRAEDERWHQRKGGERFWALGIVTPLRGDDGRLTGYSKVLRDMTDRKRAEEAIHEREERSRLIVEATRDYAILTTDPAGRITTWSPGAEAVYGWTVAEAVGQDVATTFTAEDRAAGAPEQERATADEQGSAPDVRWHVRKDGARVFIEGVTRTLAGGFLKIGQDVTERRRSEEELRESEARLKGQKEAFEAAVGGAPLEACLDVLLRTVTERAGDGVRAAFYVVDGGGACLRPVSTAGGMPESYARQVDGFKIGLDSLACGLAAASGSPVITRDVFEEPRWAPWLHLAREFDFRGCWSFPIETDTGKPVGTFAMYHRQPREATPRDLSLANAITQAAAIIISRHTEAQERKRAEVALRESEERLLVALSAGQMGTWLWRIPADEQILDDSLRRLMGLRPGVEVMDLRGFLRAVHPDDRERVRAEFERCQNEGCDLNTEFRVTWPDGTVHWLRDQGKMFPGPDGRALFMAGAAMDITERKRMEQELRETDRRKDEFLAMLGHEVRNPLAPLRSTLEILRRNPDGQARAYAMMDRQVGHLTRLVDDLLDVSRITRGLVELHREPVCLAELAGEAAEMATPAIDAKGHELNLSLPRKPLKVEGDSVRLTQVVFNLLSNAAKYTDPNGRIWLTVERDGDRALVRVRDNGSGIPPDLLPKVFDVFTQGQRSLDRSQGGLGLGLALVKRLVEMHGGTVGASSPGIGKGSEFVIRLPALPAEAAPPPQVPQQTAAPRAAARVGRALVVDDNSDVAESLTWMLEGLAEEVKMAHSGPQALELAPGFVPDVILCDIGMPGMDGYETARRQRRLPGVEKTVIAAVSGYGSEEDRRKSKEAGFDLHLVKPIGRATVEQVIRKAVEGRLGTLK